MPGAPQIDRWKKGDPFSAGHLNQMVDAIRPYVHVGASGASVMQTPSGTTIHVHDKITIQAWGLGLTTDSNAGAGGGTDYADPRYYVQQAYVAACGSTDLWPNVYADPPSKDENNNYIDPYPVTVVNLAEWAIGTHSLPKGTPVQFFAILDRQDPPVMHWFINTGGGLPKGQYQYTIYQMVSQNQGGFDFLRAHPLVG